MAIGQGADQNEIYVITLQGRLNESWSEWWNGMYLAVDEGEGGPTTTLAGRVADQAALRGLLIKLWDLNLVVLSVVRVAEMDTTLAKKLEDSSSTERS